MLLEAGKTVEGKVTGITPFGAFVDLGGGTTGLVHISEVALEYVKNIADHIKSGEKVKVKVLSVDEKGKVSLSIKQVLLDEKKQHHKSIRGPVEIDWSKPKEEATSFEAMMNRFKQDSDEKMQDIKKGVESKRGSSYRRSSGSY